MLPLGDDNSGRRTLPIVTFVLIGINVLVFVLLGGILTSVPAYVMIGLWIVLQFANGFASIADTAQTDGVAYAAHVGGFLAGLVLTFLLRGVARPQLAAGAQRTNLR